MNIDNDNTAKYTALTSGVGFLIIGFAVMLPTVTSQTSAESDKAINTPDTMHSLQEFGPEIAASSSVIADNK